MAYALVGSVGVRGGGTPVTPAWGTGETRAAGNLLICWGAANTVSGLTASAGWTKAIDQSSGGVGGQRPTIFYRVATGADAAPTITDGGGGFVFAQLAEFSGSDAVAPLDQVGSVAGTTTSPIDAIAAAADLDVGQLIIAAGTQRYSVAVTATLGLAFNNGATANTDDNDTQSTREHLIFGWGITTGNAAADDNTYTFSTTSAQTAAAVIATFKLAGATPPPVIPAHYGRTRARGIGRVRRR